MKLMLKLLAGIVLLVLILWMTDLSKLYYTLLSIDLRFLFLALLAYLCLSLLLSFRLRYCLDFVGFKLSWKDVFWTHLFGMLWSDVTPGRVGYVGLTRLLRKKKVPLSHSLACITTIEAIEFIVKAIAATLGLLFLLYALQTIAILRIGMLGILFVSLVGCGFLVMCWKDLRLLNRWIRRIPFGKKLFVWIKRFKGTSKQLKELSLFIVCTSLFGWLLRGIEWTLIGHAVGMGLPFLVFLMLHPLLTAIRFVPLTVAGMGLFEGATMIGFSLFGIPVEHALLLAFLDRADNLIVDLFALKEFRRL